MASQSHRQTALLMVQTHGAQAHGIARQHEAEARQRGDTAELERWQDIELAIAELRHFQTAAAANPGRKAA